jgi:hypothetical protein
VNNDVADDNHVLDRAVACGGDAGQADREVMTLGAKPPVRHGREWARTLSLLFALPALFLVMWLMIRSCGTEVVVPGLSVLGVP